MKARFWLVFLVASIIGFGASSAAAQQQQQRDGESSGDAATVTDEPSPLFLNPLDFSRLPELPEVEAPTADEIQESIDRGITFLLEVQNPNGSWGSHDSSRPFEVYAPIPGAHQAFRAATTGLCVAALLEAAPDRSDVQASVERAYQWMKQRLPDLRRGTPDTLYNVWGHAYCIRALVRLHQQTWIGDEQRAEVRQLIEHQLQMLDRYESVDGGWGYYDFRAQAQQPTTDSMSFVNATVLLAMHEAGELGIELNSRTVQRAIDATVRQRRPDFSYIYGEYLRYSPNLEINRPGGSLARSQACNLALRIWGDEAVTDNVIEWWLVRFYVRHGWLDRARKLPVPHESWMQVSGYFYYYGHFYAAQNLPLVDPSRRPVFKAMIARLLVDRQEPNGAWWDYPLYDYGRQYGTGYALFAMAQCKPSDE